MVELGGVVFLWKINSRVEAEYLNNFRLEKISQLNLSEIDAFNLDSKSSDWKGKDMSIIFFLCINQHTPVSVKSWNREIFSQNEREERG